MRNIEAPLSSRRFEQADYHGAFPAARPICRPFIASALILDLLPAALHILCLILNMTLDYTQEHILTFLNIFSLATAIVTIGLFILSFVLRCFFLKSESAPGASLIITAPSFLISLLSLLLSISLLAYSLCS